MIIEVSYQNKNDAADRHAKVFRTEFFESSTMPDKDTIVKKLTAMHRDFAEQTISMSEADNQDAAAMRRSGLDVHKI